MSWWNGPDKFLGYLPHPFLGIAFKQRVDKYKSLFLTKGFSTEWGKLLFQIKFLAVGTILAAFVLEKIFPVGSTVLVLKLDKGRIMGGGAPP